MISRSGSRLAAGAFVLLAMHLSAPADAAVRQVKPGETLTLTEDLVLTGDDVLEVTGTPQNPCTIVGNGHTIRTRGEWTGRLKIVHCTLRQAGKTQKVIKVPNPKGGWPGFKIEDPDVPACEVVASGSAEITIEHCTFDACSFLLFTTNGNSTIAFRGNTVLENALFPVSEQPSTSRPCFAARGSSPARKLFQANRIYKGGCEFRSSNWLIGGETDAESNIIAGLRGGIIAAGAGSTIRGNYVRVRMPGPKDPPYAAYWSQVSTFTTGAGTIAERNVIRDGEWIVRFVEGEFRYNLICDINDHDLCQNGSIGRIHHNIFFAGKPDHPPGSMYACIAVIYAPKEPGGGIEIWNNVFDGCGTLPVPGIGVSKEAFVKSLRNNVFCNLLGSAMVAGSWDEKVTTLIPERMGYADYNCFHNPGAPTRDNYAVGVVGKTERTDDGFARHDLPVGGAVDEQVGPKFTGPLPDKFPFSDEDIKAGKVTVSEILKFYRDAYTPVAGSPLIDAGDPADGEGTDIGAVDAGKPAKVKGF